MNSYKMFIFLFLIISSCCGSSDDDDFPEFFSFRLEDRLTGEFYFTVNGPFFGEVPRVFSDDGITEVEIEHLLGQEFINIPMFRNYGMFSDSQVERKYYIQFPSNDIDTLDVTFELQDGKCNRLFEIFENATYNDSFYVNNNTFLK